MRTTAKVSIIIALLFIAISGGLIYYNYFFVYSDGIRVGVLIKFSNKGTIFKTYEGEIIQPGITSASSLQMKSNTFKFSVTNQELANKLMNLQGQEVEIHYKQFHNSLPWRGDDYTEQDGQYIADELVKVKNEKPNAYGL